jgi:type III secretion system YscQ/HrcQ family protein
VAGGTVKTAPFDLRSCPSVGAAEAHATRVAARVLASLPGAWRVDLPPLGEASLTVAGIDATARPPDAIALSIGRGRDRGRLSLAQPFAARLVDAALGGRGVFSAARPLGPAERAVLVALLAPLLDAIGWSPDLAPEPTATAGPGIAVGVEGAFGVGVLWLDLPASAAPTAPEAWWRRAAGLPVEACVEIAATELPASELARLACGDALVFDGTGAGAFAANTDWEGRLAIGDYAAALRLDLRGALTLVGDFQLTGAPAGRKVGVAKEGTMDVTGPTEMATAALAAAPIEIVAELARLTLRGEELLGLAPGVVLTVTADRRRAVVLRAGGEAWAEGELVDVEGELGVRVTRLLRP